ncbi:ras-GEF domain-containing family member 1C [Scaptodrosophila lebanonensis]|uniref:Ras-GEF domain-containing family member 1C n=1 Tax=Drosophila lebanonensis TaxID=7225 RepID=A0A6J2T7M1_DROLE|nr:ras-GEF domain-containing family member 1C [Scaptodrosophila lebanonensis]
MDEDIMNAVESLFGKDVKIVDCETSSSVQQEEVLLINGVPVKLDGLPADDARAIKSALLDGQMPAVEHLNQLLFRAGLAQKPIEVETSLTVKSSLTTTEEVLVSRNGQVLDERTIETKEHFNHQSQQKEIWNPLKQQPAIARLNSEKALKYRSNSNSTFASQASGPDSSASNLPDRLLNQTFSNASMMSSNSLITDSDQVIGSSTTIGDKSSNISSCDSGHDGLFHSVSLTAPWSHVAGDTQTDSMYCDIPSSADEADTVSTSVRNPNLKITEERDEANECQTQPNYAKDIPQPCTLDALIKLLTTSTDEEFHFTLLLCARLVLQPHELLAKVAQKIQMQGAEEKDLLVHLLTYWLHICPADFGDEALLQVLRELTTGNYRHRSNLIAFFETIPDSLGQIDAKRKNKLQYLVAKQSSSGSLGRQSSFKSLKRFATNVYKSDNVFNICSSAFELAHQLYAIEHAYLSHMRLEEFLEMLVSDELKRCISETDGDTPRFKQGVVSIAAYVKWFNRIKHLVVTEILKQSKKSQRVQMIDYWIETALECFNTGNFNSLMAIIGALNMKSIKRLKKTWSKVQKTKFVGLEHQMDPTSNFANYRSTMKAAVWRSERESANKIERAIIPYFLLFLKDFCSINEKYTTHLAGGNINFEKFIRFGTELQSFYKWQRVDCPYDQLQKVVNYLQNAETLSDDSLMKASYEYETPDGAEEKDHYKTLKAAKK